MVEFQDTPAEGFGMIPNWLVRESNITAYGLLVYVALTGRTSRTGECWPSIATLAREARCSESTARRAVKELQLAGLLTVTERRYSDGSQGSNSYQMHLNATHGTPLSQTDRTLPATRGEAVTQTPKEETLEEEPIEEEPKELKITPWSDRPKAKVHRSDAPASTQQIVFLRDCFILLHSELPDEDDLDWMRNLTSAEAHDNIRTYWSEIENGADDLLRDALEYEEHLSPRALEHISNRLDRAA